MKKIITYLLFLTTTISFAQDTTLIETTNWVRVEEQAYTYQFPAEWIIERPSPLGMKIALKAPLENDEDTFHENINVITQDLGGLEMSLKDYTTLSVAQLGTFIKAHKIITNETITKNERTYQKLVYSGTTNNLNLTCIQHFTIKEGKVYIFTFAALTNEFKEQEALGEAILNTFVLKN